MAVASVDQFGVLIPQSYSDFGGGNHFVPLSLSPEGIFYSDDAKRNGDRNVGACRHQSRGSAYQTGSRLEHATDSEMLKCP